MGGERQRGDGSGAGGRVMHLRKLGVDVWRMKVAGTMWCGAASDGLVVCIGEGEKWVCCCLSVVVYEWVCM